MTIEHSRNGALCPACGEGHLSSHVEYEPVEYNGQQKELPLYYSVCDHCGSELSGAAEGKLNARAMTAFKKSVDGLLSGDDIKQFRKRFRLTQDVCATLFGGGAVAFTRYERDDVVQSSAMDKLIRLCQEDPQNIVRLAKQVEFQLSEETLKIIDGDCRRLLLNAVENAERKQGNNTPTWSWAMEDSCNDNVFLLRPEDYTAPKYLDRQAKAA